MNKDPFYVLNVYLLLIFIYICKQQLKIVLNGRHICAKLKLLFEKLISLIDNMNDFLTFLIDNGFNKELINVNIWIKPNRSVYTSGFYYQVIKTIVLIIIIYSYNRILMEKFQYKHLYILKY